MTADHGGSSGRGFCEKVAILVFVFLVIGAGLGMSGNEMHKVIAGLFIAAMGVLVIPFAVCSIQGAYS